MTISPARTIAFDILRRVNAEGSYASDLLHNALGARTIAADASLATEITLGVLRWQRLLDCQLDTYLKVPASRLDPEVAVTLRMGLYQLRFLDRVPAHAAVHESVELAKRCGKVSAASLVNAVLRRASRDPRRAVDEFVSKDRKPADRLAIIHSHPTWMVERWLERFGEEHTIALLESNNRPANMACRLNAGVTDAEIQSELRAQNLETAAWQIVGKGLDRSRRKPFAGRCDATRTNFHPGRSFATDSLAARGRAGANGTGCLLGSRRKDDPVGTGGRADGAGIRDRPAHASLAIDENSTASAAAPRTSPLWRWMARGRCPSRENSTASWWMLRARAPARWRAIRRFAGGYGRTIWRSCTANKRGCWVLLWKGWRRAGG